MTPFLHKYTYYFLFTLLAGVYIAGLFVPLMDNDSAHHANIALHMHLTGDYVSLVDNGKDYLDKPHFHFWLVALSYKVFGVTGFAYKFPSLLFSVAGIYATYRLGKLLAGKETGKLAALLLASACAFILANNDVRMDAILTASIIIATWQLIVFTQNRCWKNGLLAALGLAMGFSTKGHIALIIPAIAALTYIAEQKAWRIFLSWQWWLLVFAFCVFISPELYCYYQQFNLHPEKVVRGKDHINGVQFILYGQGTERFEGKNFGSVNGRDYFFFFHTFLWAFAPWSILAGWALLNNVKRKKKTGESLLLVTPFVCLLLIITFSGFKLPHYLNVIFPTSAIMTAAFIMQKKEQADSSMWIVRLQWGMTMLLLILCAILAAWLFPVSGAGPLMGIVLLLSTVFYFIKTNSLNSIQKAVAAPVTAMALLFLILNTHVYPRMLQYQGGNELAQLTRGKVAPSAVYNWRDEYSSSYNFYSGQLVNRFSDSLLTNGKTIWLLYDEKFGGQIDSAGFRVRPVYRVPSYRITQPRLSFLDPSTRDSVCSRLVLGVIGRK